MADFAKFGPRLIDLEKGYVNRASDRGGPTKYGITLKTWRAFGYDKNGDGIIDAEDVKLITKAEALLIAKKQYWDYFKADLIRNQSVAEFLVDWGYNSGQATAAIRLQRILEIPSDGKVGAGTLRAINKANQERLFIGLKEQRKAFIEQIVKNDPSQYANYNGWMNRIESFFFLQTDSGLV